MRQKICSRRVWHAMHGLSFPSVPGSRPRAEQGYSEWCDPEARQHRLAFDHALLLETALAALRVKVQQGALPLHLMADKFTLTELQRACEAVLGIRLDTGAFRRLIKDVPSLRLLPGEFLRGPQRPAQLFQAAAEFQF